MADFQLIEREATSEKNPNFDKSRRMHWRSDGELKRIHRNLPWDNRRVRWGMVLIGFLAAAILTQLFI